MQEFETLIHQLLNEGKYSEARKLIYDAFDFPPDEMQQHLIWYKLQICGLLIDLGSESHNKEDLIKAIKFWEKHKLSLLKLITPSSYYYVLANAKGGLGRFFFVQNRGQHPCFVSKKNYQETIQYYWLAYKNASSETVDFQNKIKVNLANTLTKVGRLVEASQFLDLVLRDDSQFPHALISRADNLNEIIQVTNCKVTTALYAQIFKNLTDGIKTELLVTSHLNHAKRQRQIAKAHLKFHGFDVREIKNEILQTRKEYKSHTNFRKFCIDNFLTLNEHGIYCPCVANAIDDLWIGISNIKSEGDVVLKMELLLNRLKAEFAHSRWFYYQSLNKSKTVTFDVHFSELLDGELISPESEMLRSSFRLCYGILDKIALGICKLYNLDTRKLYFEKFWYEPERKEQIGKINNINLNALFSIACDLDSSNGELKHFKDWRNKLEHNLLILKDDIDIQFDLYKLFEDPDFVTIVNVSEFREKTMHLLQLTRAAIFSFVYCIRFEVVKSQGDLDVLEVAFPLHFKS